MQWVINYRLILSKNCDQALELKQMQKMFLLKTMAGPGWFLLLFPF